ncbi:unnamed protein product, partial [Rotaria sordida]
MVQISNGSFYDISSPMSRKQTKTKRSLNDAYIIRSKQAIIKQAYVNIKWNTNRERRDIDEPEMVIDSSIKNEERLPVSKQMSSSTLPSVSLPDKIENITIPSVGNDTESMINATINTTTTTTTTPRPIPKKSRHLYLEITAIVDSLITNDLRTMLNK